MHTGMFSERDFPTAKQLRRSTVTALLLAAILLVTVVYPSEYGIDPTGIGDWLGLKQMGEVKTSLAQEATQEATQNVRRDMSASVPAKPRSASGTAEGIASQKQDSVTITLRPGQGAEVKLVMQQDAEAVYEWIADAPINVDVHGEPVEKTQGPSHSYKKERQIAQSAGTIVAAFEGTHGWFWRNRTERDVTLRLSTSGMYKEMKRIL